MEGKLFQGVSTRAASPFRCLPARRDGLAPSAQSIYAVREPHRRPSRHAPSRPRAQCADALLSPLDAGAAPGGAALPVWDLGDLYRSPEDPALAADLEAAETEAKGFAARHAGTLGAMDGAALAAAIAEYERIEERLGKAMSYAQLVFSGDAQDPANGRFYQTVQERVTAISSHLLFFTLELNRLEDAELERKFAGAGGGAGALAALAARPARVPPAPALRRGGEAAAREGGDGPQRLEPPVRRDRGRHDGAGRRARS